jgi:membrane protease YdiL (CAAX protease family)
MCNLLARDEARMALQEQPIRIGRGWRYIGLAELGVNTVRAYAAALAWIVLWPLGVAVMIGVAAGISGVVRMRPPDVTMPGTAILEQYAPIVVAGAAVLYAVARIHRRPWQSLFAADLRIDPRRLAIGFAVELAILAAQLALIGALTGWGWSLSLPDPLGVFVLAVALIPLQAASEELLFRGYLTQALGRALRSRLVIALIVGLCFGVLHLDAYGPLTLPYFLVLSLIFSLVSLRDDRLELVIGGHAAMNLFAFIAAGSIALGPEAGGPGLLGAAQSAVPFNWAALVVLTVNGGLFYLFTRIGVRLLSR